MEEKSLSTQVPALPRPADSDPQFIALWLGRQRSPHTQRSYRRDLNEFLTFCGGRALGEVRMSDVQAYAESLGVQTVDGYESRDGRGASTHGRILATLKSLLSFAHKTGYVPFNVGQAIQIPRSPGTLNERILSESEVLRMIHGEPGKRNRALLLFLYVSGARVSEVVRLEWRHIKPREDGCAHVTLYGKGQKTRVVIIPASAWRELETLRDGADATSPVFRSRKGGKRLTSTAIWRAVKNAAARAGIEGKVSPHWLRHANASHALQRGCNIETVRQTLGHSSLATTSTYVHAKPEDSSGLHLPV